MLVVSALPNVMASVLPAVPTIAVVFATVAVLVKSLKVSLSLPLPRLMLALLAAVPSVTMSAAGAADQRFDVADRAGIVELARVSVLVLVPRSTACVGCSARWTG